MIRIKEVETVAEAQIVRMIRNAVAGTFTTHNQHITSEQQCSFFTATQPGELYLYYDEFDAPCGFGYITMRGTKLFATLGVLPEFQNKGIGATIYQHLASLADKQNEKLWLEIFGDNQSSLVAALKAGFQIISAHDNIATLVK